MFSFSYLSLCTFLPTRSLTQTWHGPVLAGVLVTTQRFTCGMSKTLYIRCIRSIWNSFGLAYLLSICVNTSNLPSAYINSKLDNLSFAVDSRSFGICSDSVQNKCKCIYWQPFVFDPCGTAY